MITIESADLRVDLLPNVGGKIGQIQYKRSHQELLIPAQKPYQQIPSGREWMYYDTSGMDDCFPNIAPGPYPFAPWIGTPLPQLGEWVYEGWEVKNASEERAILERSGVLLPYHARKVMGFADSETLEIQYSVENLSQFPMRYIWSAHPLFVVSQGFGLKLPSGDIFFQTFPADGNKYRWPLFNSTDLSHQWIPNGTTLKIFLGGLRDGWCQLSAGGYDLQLSFDLAATPFVGLWFNNFGFPPEHPFRCIAVEPCTAQTDLLDKVEASSCSSVAPRSVNQWWFKLRVISRAEP